MKILSIASLLRDLTLARVSTGPRMVTSLNGVHRKDGILVTLETTGNELSDWYWSADREEQELLDCLSVVSQAEFQTMIYQVDMIYSERRRKKADEGNRAEVISLVIVLLCLMVTITLSVIVDYVFNEGEEGIGLMEVVKTLLDLFI